jgi:hypothetical protein
MASFLTSLFIFLKEIPYSSILAERHDHEHPDMDM